MRVSLTLESTLWIALPVLAMGTLVPTPDASPPPPQAAKVAANTAARTLCRRNFIACSFVRIINTRVRIAIASAIQEEPV
jgi:hypothetical protein